MEIPTIPLLPCPWCGCDKVELIDGLCRDGEYITDDNDELRCVWCPECRAHGPAVNRSDAGAAVLWNKGPYADRLEAHRAALLKHSTKLQAEADRLRAKADELERKAMEVANA